MNTFPIYECSQLHNLVRQLTISKNVFIPTQRQYIKTSEQTE